LSKKDGANTPTSKLKRSAIEKSRSGKKPARLKLSSWYEKADRSIGIRNKKAPEKVQ
jgi:hypothetical protein